MASKLAREGKGKLTLKVKEETKNGSTVIIGPVRLSHLSIFKVRTNDQRGAEEYSGVFLIEKTDTEMLKFIRERLNHAITKKFGKLLPKFVSCLEDGDVETDKENNPKYPGFFFIASRAEPDQKPLVFDPKANDLNISDAQHWVSGDWGNVKLDFFGYDSAKKQGASTRIKALQFTAKDTPFGRGAEDPDKVRDEFGAAEEVEEREEKSGGFLD